MATRYYFLRDYHDPPTGNFYRAGIAAPISDSAIISRVLAVSPPIAFTEDGLIDPANAGLVQGLQGRLANGSAGSPSLAFDSNTNMGLYRIANNRLGMAVSGALQAEVDSDGLLSKGSRVYRRSNILGTVSQSGGVPTSAIIERGSNANGEYVRFADGTQICTQVLLTGTASSTGETGFLWTLPASFTAVYSCSGELFDSRAYNDLANGNYTQAMIGVTAVVPRSAIGGAASSIDMRCLAPGGTYVSGTTRLRVQLTAIGRWF